MFRNHAGNQAGDQGGDQACAGMLKCKAWGVATLPEPVESIACAMSFVPPAVMLKFCGNGSSLTRALGNVPLRAGPRTCG